jgi:VanZ family protein
MAELQTATGKLHSRLWWVVIPLWVYAAAISIGSAIPTPPSGPPWIPYFDKFEHIIEYGILGALAARFALTSPREVWRKLAWWLFPILIACYGYLDEVHQYFVPGRIYSLGDWAADCTGGILGVLVMLSWGRKRISPASFR